MLKKSRSPWLIVLAGGIISLFVVLVLGMLLNLISEDVVLPEFEYQTTMPDGTILVVEAVSWGTTHNVELRGLPKPGLFGGYYFGNDISQSTAGDRLVVFMRRFDPETGRPLDFTWWGSSSAVDSFGSEIPDSNPYQQVMSGYSTSSGGGRPLPPPGAFGYYDPRDPRNALVAYSDFPAIRVEGDTFHLLVKNTSGEVVGEFDLPYGGPRTSDVWTPDPLPVTQTDHGLTLTYTGANITIDGSSTVNGVVQYRYQLNPEVQFQYNGEPAPNWSYNRIWLEDPLGNSSESYDLKLSPGEPAWKMHLTGYCYDWTTVPLAPGESAAIGTFTLPAESLSAPISASATAGGKSLSWSWIGGPNVTHNIGGATAYNGSWSSYLYIGADSISVELRGDSYSPRQLIVGGNAYTLVATDPGYGSAAYLPHHMEIQITTPEGVAIPSNSTTMDNLVVTGFQPPEGVTEVVATLIVRELPEFELLIAPPEHPPLPVQAMPGEPKPIDMVVPSTEAQPDQTTLPVDTLLQEVPVPEPPPPM